MRYLGVTLILLTLSLGGCMVGPDYKRPETAAVCVDEFVNSPYVVDVNDITEPGRWWTNFADDATISLVETAIQNNQDIRVAAARVLQARGTYKAASGQQLPQFDYGFSRMRAKSSIDLPGGLQQNLSTTYDNAVSVSYVVDVFGKLKRTERSAWDEVLASENAKLSVIQTVIADVVKARTNIGNIEDQLEISRGNTKSWNKTLTTIERRYKRGLLTALDVRLARENYAASLASEKEFEQLLHLEQHRLDVLLGVAPGTMSRTLPRLRADMPLFDEMPKSVPAAILERRPDLRRAESQLAAATELIGVNKANMLPDLSITAGYGFRSSNFDDLLLDDYEVYNLLLNAAQPIFRGGQLEAQVEISEARASELAAEYAGSVLNAMREVEDALVKEKLLRERLDSLRERLKEAKAGEKLARDRYFRGLEKLVTVLEIERRKRTAELDVTTTIANIWQVRVDLYLALGGDWKTEELVDGCQDKS